MGLEGVSEGIKAYYEGATTMGEIAQKAAAMEGADFVALILEGGLSLIHIQMCIRDRFLGVDPYVSGSSEMCELLTEGTRKWTGAAYTVETDIEKLVDLMIERIEEKRTALGI